MLINRTMPTSTVMPVLAYDDVREAAFWLCETFGFTERWRAGSHRAQLAVGDGAVAIRERSRVERVALTGEVVAASPLLLDPGHSLIVRVVDVEIHHDRARAKGARILQPPTDFPYGERQYTAVDLGGHTWSFSQTVADVAPEEWGGTSGPGL